jgi:hypothetical protein
MKKVFSLFFLALVMCTFLTRSAIAEDEIKKACLKEALQDWRQANQDANFELRATNFTCRFGPEIGACMTNCLPALKACLQPVYDSLKNCRESCTDTLIAARKAARESLGCGTTCNTNGDFQKAIVEANLAYQSCRITCRSSDASVNARAGCRTAHGLCVNACK